MIHWGPLSDQGAFFVLTDFEKAVVDMEDVFAVGITGDYKYQDSKEEAVLCAVFTNDPYIPQRKRSRPILRSRNNRSL